MIADAATSFDLFHQPPAPAPAPPAPLIGSIPLRWCQHDDVNALMHVVRSGVRSACAVAATGYGKGVLIAETVARLLAEGDGTVHCLVDRTLLVHQLADEVERHLRLSVGRVADGACFGLGRRVVVATVQAMYTPGRDGRRLYEYSQFQGVGAIVVDEGHKFFADVFRSVPDYFVGERDARVVGFTATPMAANGAKWTEFWDWTAPAEGPCMRTTNWCVEAGYLVPMVQAFVQADLDLSSIYDRLSDAGDDGESEDDSRDELATVLHDLLSDKQEQSAAKFAKGVAEVIGSRQAIVFAPHRVNVAKLLASWINSVAPAEAVWGSRGDRDEVLKTFKSGQSPQVVSNVNLLVEGANYPLCSAEFICRKVTNWRVKQQMAGRVLRPHPLVVDDLKRLDGEHNAAARRQLIATSAKPNALIADLVGRDGKILQASAVDVLYGGESEDVKAEMALQSFRRQRSARPADIEHQPVDAVARESAKSEVIRKQHERLAEMARHRGMAGDVMADVRVTYGDSDVAPLASAPTARAIATVAEQAMFVAMATQYDTQRAVDMAQRMDRKQIKGMTFGLKKKLEQAGKRPDWHRARQAFPEWAKQKAGVK